MPGKQRRVYTTRRPIDYLTRSQMPSAGNSSYNPRKPARGYQGGGSVYDDGEHAERTASHAASTPTKFADTAVTKQEGYGDAYSPGERLKDATTPSSRYDLQGTIRHVGKLPPRTTESGRRVGLTRREAPAGYRPPTSSSLLPAASTIYQAADQARKVGLWDEQGLGAVSALDEQGLDYTRTTDDQGNTYLDLGDRDDSLETTGSYSGMGMTSEGLQAAATAYDRAQDPDEGQGVASSALSAEGKREEGGVFEEAQRRLLELFRGSAAGESYFKGYDDVQDGGTYWVNASDEDSDTVWQWDPEVGDYVARAKEKGTGYGFSGDTDLGTVALSDIIKRDAEALLEEVRGAAPEEKATYEEHRAFLAAALGEDTVAQAFGDPTAEELAEQEASREWEPGENAPERVSDEEMEENAARAAKRVQESVSRTLRGAAEKMGARGATAGQMAGVVTEMGSLGAAATEEAAFRSETADKARNLAIDLQLWQSEEKWNLMILQGELAEGAADALHVRNLDLFDMQKEANEELTKLQAELNRPTAADRWWQLAGMILGGAVNIGASVAGGWASRP